MGILKTIAEDIRILIEDGYTDREIAGAVGFDISVIKHIIDYYRNQIEEKELCIYD